MTVVTPIPHHPTFAPREDKPTPERLISGTPEFKTWAIDEVNSKTGGWNQIRTGVWEATPGVTKSIKGDMFEFCHLIAGKVEITGADGSVQTYVAGDSFTMAPGFVGEWKTIETVKKIYVFASLE